MVYRRSVQTLDPGPSRLSYTLDPPPDRATDPRPPWLAELQTLDLRPAPTLFSVRRVLSLLNQRCGLRGSDIESHGYMNFT